MSATQTPMKKPRLLVPQRSRRMLAPPGPTFSVPIRELNRIRAGGLIPYLQGLVRQHGNVVCVRFGPVWVYVINEPEMIRDVLQRQHKSFTKGYGADILKEVAGLGVFFAEGTQHRRQRKLMQPAFHKECLKRYSSHMIASLCELDRTWCEGASIDIAESMGKLTVDVIMRSLFSSNVAEHAETVGETLGTVLEIALGHLLSPLGALTLHVPTPTTLRYRRALRQLDRLVNGLIAEHRDPDSVFDDLMNILVHAADTDGEQMSLRQLRDEAMTLFIAGHETTAIALSWAWYELSKDAALQARLQHEVDAVLGGRLPTFEDLNSLRLCRQLMQESMRVYPPVYMFLRQACEQVEVGSYTLPEGAHVVLCPYLTHRDARFFPNPDRFDPDRWTPEFEEALPKFAYFPFGGGPRICLGERFAWTEGVLSLAYLAQRWTMTLESHQSIGFGNALSLRPDPGIDVRLSARRRVP